MSRCTARRTAAEWRHLRAKALHHLHLALRIAMYQHSQQRTATFEQPPTCVSWRLRAVGELLKLPGWSRYTWPSCVYNHRDPGNGLPYKKMQVFPIREKSIILRLLFVVAFEHRSIRIRTVRISGSGCPTLFSMHPYSSVCEFGLRLQAFAANVDLSAMVRPCTCFAHQRVHSFVGSGLRRGESRAAISGAYPPAMCDALVRILLQSERASRACHRAAAMLTLPFRFLC